MNLGDSDGVIWMDGAMVPWREATTHVLTHTLHYGVGVFEGVRAYQGEGGTAVFRLQDHTDRLYRSAHIMAMTIPFTPEEINQAQIDVVRENQCASAYIRPLVFYGSESMSLRPHGLTIHVAVAAWEWGTYLGEEGLLKGIDVRTSSFTRHHVNISMCRAKTTGNYVNSILALQEALDTGADEALMLDAEGYVMEGSGENIFIVRDGCVYTPDLTSALEGITRDTVITLTRDLGYTLVEKRITRDEVYVADEAFFTGTAAEVTPIRSLDGRQIGNGARGPVTERIQSRFFDVVNGRAEPYQDWLTPVSTR